MFYCAECAKKRLWPVTMFQSLGPCETCGRRASCSELPSSKLPLPLEPITVTIPGEGEQR